ncbi:hypothetical protein [Methylobacterium haplocladii]|uniref:Uncharacterized protein n=1 Tax=Methylobacterium haplocladii TaxID=1176176 RepID=A0A512IRD3_9HYPH|nr:hypothetical protein [Methylobacterium haplocladii]GEP00268.1 hypothetical protein MHA02_26550 [Methylobacterium haplocladii]GJD84224.1 hypothetical protein HPGCJGGD_2099 [Methylobacterium haplocladii]GLS60405.1 hypothetical protein GCM10007887_30840 [Methylobacterium haplocladii]
MRREPTFDDLDFDDADDMRRLDAPRAFGRTSLAVRFVLAAAAITGLTLFARDRTAPASSQSAWTDPKRILSAPSARAAIPASTAGPLLAMDAADPPARSEPPRRNATTGLREDALTQGGFDAIDAPFLRLTLTEAGQIPDPATSLFVTLARRAAEMQGLSVVRTGVRGMIETKFGPFETVEATLSGHGSRLCTGFTGIGTRAMRIDGWLCGVLGQAPEPRTVACAIDDLKLAIAATPTIEVVFGEAELRRTAGCGAKAGVAEIVRGTEETGSIAGRKTTTGDRNSRRPRKNEAELRRNAEARL